jgi:hypothetical protein
VAGTDTTEVALAEPEGQADIFQKLHLGIRDDAIGAGDLEEAIQHAFQKAGAVAVLAANAPCIAFIATHGLASDIEDPADIVGIFGRRAKNAREDHDFLICYGAVGHRELRAEADNRCGKTDIIGIGRTFNAIGSRFG